MLDKQISTHFFFLRQRLHTLVIHSHFYHKRNTSVPKPTVAGKARDTSGHYMKVHDAPFLGCTTQWVTSCYLAFDELCERFQHDSHLLVRGDGRLLSTGRHLIEKDMPSEMHHTEHASRSTKSGRGSRSPSFMSL